MPWPIGTVSNGNVDQTTDSPASARSDLNALITKVNDMISSQPKIALLNSATGFSMKALTKNTWISVGPTGSGATQIWTAIDSVPTDATGIIVLCEFYGGNFGTGFLRKNGSSSGLISANLFFRSGNATSEFNQTSGHIFVETSARKIDVYVDYGSWNPFDSNFILALVGYYR